MGITKQALFLEIQKRFKNVDSLDALDKKLLFFLFQGQTPELLAKQFNRSIEFIEGRIKKLLKRYGYVTIHGLVADYSLYLMKGYWEKLLPSEKEEVDMWKSRSAIIGMTARKERARERGELELSLRQQ